MKMTNSYNAADVDLRKFELQVKLQFPYSSIVDILHILELSNYC